jgi:hypothetical protein
MASSRHHAPVTANFAATTVIREVGNASRSLTVWSLNSRPKIQMTINPKIMVPPTATVCARNPR